MFATYHMYSIDAFKKVVQEASNKSKQLGEDLEIINRTYFHNVDQRIINRHNQLVINYPKTKEEIYRHTLIKFYYELMNDYNKKIFDTYLTLIETRVMFYHQGNVRSYKSDNYYSRFKEIVGFAKKCVLLQRLDFSVKDFLEGRQYFEKENRSDFIGSDYYGCAISIDDGSLIEVINHMIYDSEGLIRFSAELIRGMLISNKGKAQDMVMDLLKTAKLSEGLRQAVVENIDFAEVSVYQRFLKYIHEENLIRFSSVKRAYMCFTGLTGMVEDKKSKLIEKSIYECLVEGKYDEYTKSRSALDLYIGLYSKATINLEVTIKYIYSHFDHYESYQKAVALLFIRKCNRMIPASYLMAFIDKTTEMNIVGFALTRFSDQIDFANVEEKREYIKLVSKRLDEVKKVPKSYGILDENTGVPIDLSRAAASIINLSNELDEYYEYSYKHINRISYIREMKHIEHPVVRTALINLLSSNTENHRRFAYKKITETKLRLTEDEYSIIGGFLKSKRSDTRKYIMELFQQASPKVLITCGLELLDDKNQQRVAGALDILVENITRVKDEERFKQIEDRVKTIKVNEDMEETISILLGESIQIKKADDGFYDHNYMPPIEALKYDKKLVKQFLKPNEKSLLKYVQGVVAVYDEIVGQEIKVNNYNGTSEIIKFGYGYYHVLRSNYGRFNNNRSYKDFMEYKRLIPLFSLVDHKDRDLFNYYLKVLSMNYFPDRYAKRDKLFENLTQRKYYPKLKKLKKYLDTLDESRRSHYLSSCINLLNMFDDYSREELSTEKYINWNMYLNIYTYMALIDEQSWMSNNKCVAFDRVIKGLALSPENLEARGEQVYQVAMHVDDLLRDRFMTLDYNLLFEFVEKGYCKVDYVYKQLFDVQEFGNNYSSTSNSRRLLQSINQDIRMKKVSKLKALVYNTTIDSMLKVELDRTEKDTIYSRSINAAQAFYGIEVYLKSILKMGKMPFLRGYSWVSGGKKNTFSHIIYHCIPLETDSQDRFNELIKEYKISDKKLLEATMYNLRFIDYTVNYLNIKGLKKAAYYFKSHMKENFGDDDKIMIRRYTDISFEDLNRGQMDIKWFEESYHELGDKNFMMLYDCAKYITSGGNHKRAQYFADAVLGRINEEEVLERINDKRNQEMVLTYGLLPLGANKVEAAVRRYKRLQLFIKESKQFGAQRRASELLKANIAMQNLSRNYGYHDVNRFVWVMETEMVQEMKEMFEPKTIDEIKVHISVEQADKPTIVVDKKGRILKSVPAKYKKNDYIKLLMQAKKDLKEQYLRAKKSLEEAMINEVEFTHEELLKLYKHPVIKNVLKNLLFCYESDAGFITESGLKTISSEIELTKTSSLKLVHPVMLHENKSWSNWQQYIMDNKIIQPFKQVFREVYLMTKEERLNDGFTNRFAGYQIEPKQALGILKTRNWIINEYEGFEKINHIHDLRIDLYSYADWYTPGSIESPTLEKVVFIDNKSGKTKDMNELSAVIFSETMRDLDLVVSVAYVGGVDVMMNQSTIEMRRHILEHNLKLFKISNYIMEDHHIQINGTYGKYSLHLGSGIIHREGKGMLPVFPVHSQHRGHIFLPFVDEDPKTAEIISKVLMLSKDSEIKDPSVLTHLRD